MKKKIFTVACVALIAMGFYAISYSSRGDIMALQGDGILRGTDVFRITSSGNIVLATGAVSGLSLNGTTGAIGMRSGDLTMGAGGLTITTTSNHPGIMIPFFNASTDGLNLGAVVLATSGTLNTVGYGTYASVLATTSVLGVCAASAPTNTVGWMYVSGYALVLTTGPVQTGNILVSTTGSNGAGAPGYAGVTTGTEVVGTNIGTAVSSGPVTGGLTLVKLR